MFNYLLFVSFHLKQLQSQINAGKQLKQKICVTSTRVNYMCSLLECSFATVKLWVEEKVAQQIGLVCIPLGKQEMESFPPCGTNFLRKLKRIVSHLMTLMEATVIPSINNLGVISLGQTQPGKVYGRLEITQSGLRQISPSVKYIYIFY